MNESVFATSINFSYLTAQIVRDFIKCSGRMYQRSGLIRLEADLCT